MVCRSAKALVRVALLCAALFAGHALAQSAPHPGDTPTVPLSNRPIYPAEYRGDVRALPPLPAPDHYHVLNDYEGPPDLKPPVKETPGQYPLQPEAALAAMPSATTGERQMLPMQKNSSFMEN